MLLLASSWTWDFWLADDGERFHAFFLRASRALQDPDRRHRRASVGHAVSADLVTWTEVDDALVADEGPAFDDLATWTGSVVRDPAVGWRMFYTGIDRADEGRRQRIGSAVSADLTTWHRQPDGVAALDPQWYERVEDSAWPTLTRAEETWRDPWVFHTAGDDRWHMLLTARAAASEPPRAVTDRGVIGHAVSTDLTSWQVGPPLSTPDAGFGQLEVPQVEEVDGRWVLLFSCLGTELDPEQHPHGGGVWMVPAPGPLGPFDIGAARRLTTEALYAGRLVRDRTGAWVLLAFRNVDPQGGFVGGLIDPVQVRWNETGSALRMVDAPPSWRPPEVGP